MPERIKMKIGRAGYVQRIGDKDYIKTRSRIESVPMRKLARLNRLGGHTWRLVQEGRDIFLVLEALTLKEEKEALKIG
ncbi:MAG: hypothetical protein O2U62_05480 [Candidatus Bathyarchaeota archaeon]|jgi:hypothetical protein|nr:hypothetical protein [Candidatus Bathyarchaeota archaeon]